MGSEHSTPRPSRATSQNNTSSSYIPNTRQNAVNRDYARTQAELREIYEQRLVQERTQETMNIIRSKPQTVQSQTTSRNQTPGIGTNQNSSNQQHIPMIVTKPVAAPMTQKIQSGETVTRNQSLYTGSMHTSLNEQSKHVMFNRPVEATRAQTIQPSLCFTQSKPVTTSIIPTQSSTATSLERNRTPYSYSSTELQNAMQQRKKETIYPNLNNEITHTAPESTLAQGPSQHHVDNQQQQKNNFVFDNRSNENSRFTPSAPLRDRSISSDRRSRSKNNNHKNDNLSCRTCNNKFGLKIYQCPNGHSSCSDCYSRSSLCGLCRLNITDMRNIMLEDYVSQLKVPCANADEGCCLFLRVIDMEIHLKQCPFQEITCPVNGTCGHCNWQGKISHLQDHFNDIHPMQTQGNVDTELLLMNICFDSHTLYLITLGPYNFLFHVKVSEAQRKVFMAVQLLGTTISASKWDYEIHVYNKREPRRKYQFTDVCTPASTPIADLFNESNCAALPLSYAMTFINDGILYYKFFIKQNQEAKTDFNKNRRGRGAFRGRHN